LISSKKFTGVTLRMSSSHRSPPIASR
jgi:hypothetical protein